MDPFDFDLLGVNWNGLYIDNCCRWGAGIGGISSSPLVTWFVFGAPSVADSSFCTTHTRLGVEIDTVKGTVSIPQDKLDLIKKVVLEWQTKHIAQNANCNPSSGYYSMFINVSNQ